MCAGYNWDGVHQWEVLRDSIWRGSSMCGNIFIGNGLSNIAV